MSLELIQRVRTFAESHNLLPEGATVVVAVSGGPDSATLLDILRRLAPERGLALHVAHLDHALRADSGSDTEHVRAVAAAAELPFHATREDVAARALADRLSLEHAARNARLEFLEKVAEGVGASRIALGHTRNDQAETVLHRLLRGSGTTGLAGIRPIRGDLWIRPLLDVTRQEVETYVRVNGIEVLVDVTNTQRRFLRNRIRHDLLPILEADFNPAVVDALTRAGSILAADDECLAQQAVDALKSATCARSERKFALDGPRFFSYHVAIRARMLRQVILSLDGTDRAVDFDSVTGLLQALESDGSVSIGTDFTACRKGRLIFLGRKNRAFSDSVPPVGRVEFPDGWIEFAPAGVEEAVPRLGAEGPFVAYVDEESLGSAVAIRSRRPGDVIQPFEMAGRKKVQDLLVDRRVPRILRDEVPILDSANGILWVVGLRTANLGCISQNTRKAVRIEAHGGWRRMAESIGLAADIQPGG